MKSAKEFMRAADAFDAKHGKNKRTALKQLMKEGIVDKFGNLTELFRDAGN